MLCTALRFRLVAVAAFTVAFASSAVAHDPGLSSAHVRSSEQSVEVTLSFAAKDAATLVPATSKPDGSDSQEDGATDAALRSAAGSFVRVYGPTTGTLRNDSPAVALHRGINSDVTITLGWPSAGPKVRRIEFPVLAQLPFGHRMILTADDAPDPVQLLDRKHLTYDLPGNPPLVPTAHLDATQPDRPTWPSFLSLGIEHILRGFDHLCFLFALLLGATRVRDVLAVVTTFTFAHSLTLGAAATGMVSLSPNIVEPLIAASIVYVGVENLVLRRPPRHRIALVFGFGLVHGLGFATALGERLPGVTGFGVLPPLVGFNLGVELGQLAIAALLIPLIQLARSRVGSTLHLQPAFSLVITFAGALWLWQRV